MARDRHLLVTGPTSRRGRSPVELRVFDPDADWPLLRDWLQRPHVARWWGDAGPELEDLLQRSPETTALIVEDGTPVGFLCWQRPSPEELEAAGLNGLPDGLVDIDILIGEAGAQGRGVGPAALSLLLARLRTDPAVRFAGVGTSVANERALRAYEKAGFIPVRGYVDPDWGRCRYLLADVGGPG